MSVITTCSILTGDAPIRVEWYKDSAPLDLASLNIHRNEMGDLGSSLVFRSVGPAHAGNYTCFARNRAGDDSFTAPMIVKGMHISCLRSRVVLRSPIPDPASRLHINPPDPVFRRCQTSCPLSFYPPTPCPPSSCPLSHCPLRDQSADLLSALCSESESEGLPQSNQSHSHPSVILLYMMVSLTVTTMTSSPNSIHTHHHRLQCVCPLFNESHKIWS